MENENQYFTTGQIQTKTLKSGYQMSDSGECMLLGPFELNDMTLNIIFGVIVTEIYMY